MGSMAMRNESRDIYLVGVVALLGLLGGAIFSSYCHGSVLNLEEKLSRHYLAQNMVELQGNVTRRMQDGLITLVIKFLHFFISRCLQFRYSTLLHTPSFETSMLFWVALTRSVSSMFGSPL